MYSWNFLEKNFYEYLQKASSSRQRFFQKIKNFFSGLLLNASRILVSFHKFLPWISSEILQGSIKRFEGFTHIFLPFFRDFFRNCFKIVTMSFTKNAFFYFSHNSASTLLKGVTAFEHNTFFQSCRMQR